MKGKAADQIRTHCTISEVYPYKWELLCMYCAKNGLAPRLYHDAMNCAVLCTCAFHDSQGFCLQGDYFHSMSFAEKCSSVWKGLYKAALLYSLDIECLRRVSVGHTKAALLLSFAFFFQVKTELRKQWSHFLLAYPFLRVPCFLGKNIKHLGRCPKKQHLSSHGTGVTPPQNVPRTGCNVELNPSLSNPRLSTSESSEGEVTTGETIEEVFEESEI